MVLLQAHLQQLEDRARGLNTGRTSSHDHERHGTRVDVGLGPLEREEELVAEMAGVSQRVQRLRVLVGTRDAEEVRHCPACKDDVVEGQLGAAVEPRGPLVEVDVRHKSVSERDVAAPAKDRSDRVRDVGRLEPRRRNLIEEWQEGVEVVLVDNGDVHRLAGKHPHDLEPGETAADDEDLWALGAPLSRQGARSAAHHWMLRSTAPGRTRPHGAN